MLPPHVAGLRSLVGDLRQFAGVRRLVLDDGPERGVTVLAVSSGGGLDFLPVVVGTASGSCRLVATVNGGQGQLTVTVR